MEKDCKAKFGSYETMYNGIVFSIKQRDVIYPNGERERHEYCQRFDSVTILPFDQDGNLLLTKEYRIAKEKYIWFLPTGKVDKGETPIVAAQRELREEAGQRADSLKLLFDSPASSSYFLWNVYVFVAKDLVKDPLPAEEKCPIEVIPTPMKEAVRMAMDGTIENQFLAYYIIRFDYMLENNQFSW